MKKTNVRIMGISLCAIMALMATGCNNNSGNTNAATSNTTVAVSKDEYETEVTTLAATEKENNNTEITSGEVYVPSHKVDEIYNTTLEPNISDDITFQVDFKYFPNGNIDWLHQFEDDMSVYTFDLDNNPTYSDIVDNLPMKLYTYENSVGNVDMDNDIMKFKYTSIAHTIVEPTDDYKEANRISFELADTSGNIISINDINKNAHIKAVSALKASSSISNELYPCLITITVKNTSGDYINIMAGNDFDDTISKLSKLTETDENNMKAGRNNTNNVRIIKNNKYTLYIEDVNTEWGKVIMRIILINNEI